MRLFHQFTHRSSKLPPVGQSFQQILTGLHDLNDSIVPRVQFDFRDFPDASGIDLLQVRACERATKKFPDLAAFAVGPKRTTNLNSSHTPPAASQLVANETLQGVANGIPRSFPLHRAMFLFDRIPWFKKPIDAPVICDSDDFDYGCHRYFSSCIILRDDWCHPTP